MARTDRAGPNGPDTVAQGTVGRHEEHGKLAPAGRRHQRVVTGPGGVGHADATLVTLGDAGAGRTLQDHQDGGPQPAVVDRAPDGRHQPGGRTSAIPPPPVGPAAHHVGGVDEQQPIAHGPMMAPARPSAGQLPVSADQPPEPASDGAGANARCSEATVPCSGADAGPPTTPVAVSMG